MIKNLRLLAVPFILTALLSQMILERMMLLKNGTLVELQTVPVDPRSLFRGDYVILTYDISRLDLLVLPGDTDFSKGEKIFVTLAKPTDQETATWEAASVWKTYPALTEDEIAIAGRVTYSRNYTCENISEEAKERCTVTHTLDVDYGIESFFVPEGEGKPLENQRNAGAVTVRVAVDKTGKAGIKSLAVDGQTVHSETLF